jgi:5-(carboxyamino)imidazole ribonucleotide mutase
MMEMETAENYESESVEEAAVEQAEAREEIGEEQREHVMAEERKNVPVAIIMGSISDWATMKAAADILDDFDVNYDRQVVSAHRTPELMADFAHSARSNGYRVIIAGAGGAAHLPGMTAAMTTVPVIGVPVKSHALSGLDSLYSIVQMPAGVPVATMSIGESGAKNAALFAVQMLAVDDVELHDKLVAYREAAAKRVAESSEELV